MAPPFDLYRPTLTASLPTLLDHAAVVVAPSVAAAAFRMSAAAVGGFRSTLDEAGYVEVHTPKIVGSVTESGANVFQLDYFGRPAYLAQSPQFYKQTLVGVFEKVYEVGPVFRAEPHDTVRHLAEYTSLDVELGFINDEHDVMAVLRDVLAGMVAAIALRASDSVAAWRLTLPTVPEQIPLLHFTEALKIAGAPADEPDLSPAHERALGAWAMEQHGSDFVFVTGYPIAKRAFYTHPDPDRPPYSRRVRPALPRARTGQRRATTAPLRGLCPASSPNVVSGSSRTSRTSRCSGTACRHTAVSPSAWSASWPGCSTCRTCVR